MTNDLTETHPHYLMVYGTLRRGHGNNPLLVRFDSKLVAPYAVTVEKFILNDGFPYVYNPEHADLRKYYGAFLGHVVGDLYKITHACLEACDRLEGHPNHYCRTPISVKFGTPAAPTYVTAGIYLAPEPLQIDNLQEPVNGTLEWGRDDKRQARNFQRGFGGKYRV